MLFTVVSVIVSLTTPVPGTGTKWGPEHVCKAWPALGRSDMSLGELSGSYGVLVKIYTFVCFWFHCSDCDLQQIFAFKANKNKSEFVFRLCQAARCPGGQRLPKKQMASSSARLRGLRRHAWHSLLSPCSCAMCPDSFALRLWTQPRKTSRPSLWWIPWGRNQGLSHLEFPPGVKWEVGHHALPVPTCLGPGLLSSWPDSRPRFHGAWPPRGHAGSTCPSFSTACFPHWPASLGHCSVAAQWEESFLIKVYHIAVD